MTVRPNGWVFDPLTYRVGWRSFGTEPHYPFQYRSETADLADYEERCRQAANRFERELDDELYRAFVTMLAPDVRVHLCGVVGDGSKVRGYAAIRGPDGVLMRQEPGVAPSIGGPVTVTWIRPSECGRAVVAALPCVAAGGHPRIDFDDRDLIGGDAGLVGGWLRPATPRPTPAEAAARLLGRPRAGAGRIEVYRGATLSGRDTGGGRGVRWFDIVGDGRYVLGERGSTLSLAPGGASTIGEIVRTLVGAVRREPGRSAR